MRKNTQLRLLNEELSLKLKFLNRFNRLGGSLPMAPKVVGWIHFVIKNDSLYTEDELKIILSTSFR